MNEIEVTASAPDRTTALGMIVALGVATVVDGEIYPANGVHVHVFEAPSSGTRSLWNFWYYGPSAAALTRPEPEGGWQPDDDVFERTRILEMVDARTGVTMSWAAFTGIDGEPPGYETPNGCRLYDPALISSSNLVKQ